jgi:beta-1,2-mannobiose phosphorylase / 1,2-beta-oligomannan phosphorylase
MAFAKRFQENPLLSPEPKNDWEAEAVYNGCPIIDKKKFHLLYRALSSPYKIEDKELRVSSIGYAQSSDGINFSNRRQFIKPEKEWERFGCEDPRVTKLGGKYYIFYTALSGYPFNASNIKIGLAITKDFRKIEAKHPVTFFNSKAMALFPEKIGGKFAAILSVHTDSPPARNCLAFFDKESDIWSQQYWQKWYYSLYDDYTIPLNRGTKHLAEIGAPPIKTKDGWLLVYADIRNYHSPAPTVFGIEAVLLDLKNPSKIIGRTDDPLLVPAENYELEGKVPNIIFPSGALKMDGYLYIYYGAADTRVCAVKVPFEQLLEEIRNVGKRAVWLKRYPKNPILEPVAKNTWEAKAVFNPAAIYLEEKTHIIYRAMSYENTSVLGYASTKDGFSIDHRLDYPIYTPRESFEEKTKAGGNSGCEDPRLTKIGDNIFMTYTAYDGKTARVALSFIKAKDFLKQKWNWAKPVLITPPGVENKNCVLFPEKINNKYVFLHRPDHRDIWLDFVPDINFTNKKWLGGYILLEPREGSWDSLKIGAVAPPIKTEHGWLLLYHGVSVTSHYYRVGAVLLDLQNPRQVLARTRDPILEPRMPYEEEGQVNNVVFPSGVVLVDKTLYIYYGGADSVVCVASVLLGKLISGCLSNIQLSARGYQKGQSFGKDR